MSDVVQCRNCGRLFQSLSSKICPDCIDEIESSFEKVRNYIYDHPHANVMDISKGTEVPEKTVLYFLKDGRLSLGGDANGLECERCGDPIAEGRFCKACHGMYAKEFGSISINPAKKEDVQQEGYKLGRMHFKVK